MSWFVSWRFQEFIDPDYYGYEVWETLIEEGGMMFFLEQVSLAIALLMFRHLGRHQSESPSAASSTTRIGMPEILFRLLVGAYMVFSATGLVWNYHRSLGASWGALTAFFLLVYLSGGSWLLISAIFPKPRFPGSFFVAFTNNGRVSGFFSAGMFVLVPVTLGYYWTHLAVTVLGPLLIAVAVIILLSAHHSSDGGGTSGDKVTRVVRFQGIISLPCLWIGIFLFVCFMQRTFLLEDGWHLLRRLATSIVFLLFGLALSGNRTRPESKGVKKSTRQDLLVVAAVLALSVFTWRVGATVYLTSSVRRTMNIVLVDMERNNCNRMGEVSVDLVRMGTIGIHFGSWNPDCDKWYQLVFIGKDRYYLNDSALYSESYYDSSHIKESSIEKMYIEMPKRFDMAQEYPEEISGRVLVAIDREASWDRVCRAIDSATAAGFRKFELIFMHYYKDHSFSKLLDDPPLLVKDMESCNADVTYYGGTRLIFCARLVDRVGAFCPGVHEDWWGSQGTALDRLRWITAPHMVDAYQRCLGDMDLDAFQAVMAFMFWQQPAFFLEVNIVPPSDTEARALSLPASTPWHSAHIQLLELLREDRSRSATPVKLAVQ